MLFKTSEGNIIVKFQYDKIQTSRRIRTKSGEETNLVVPRTTCIIKDANANTISEAYVQLFSQDQFKRATGRKKALEKALEKAGFNRNLRAEIWKQYWEEIMFKVAS